MQQQTGPAWETAQWLNRPPRATTDDTGALVVTTADGTDFWRRTSYGYIRDDGHALLTPFPQGGMVEVTFEADFTDLYDQAGLMIRVDAENWVKAGIEYTDGAPHLSAVVTREFSDWSQSPVPDWAGAPVTIRAARAGDALTLRARRADGPWRMFRLVPLAPDAPATAGPFCCSPEREGLTVRFTTFTTSQAEAEAEAGAPQVP
ncbi:DUF1349 domain-containing protein [Streptomyces sp. PLAI1-29]|uniref:DUF1349 domain-containing protein n=1 Tax=Streptomyces zingiberis TaxID=2053010 RepID=A0ABX1C9E4_9ACTN|nr:DUF1349 domain-containing protein [Streptomyces zingiberis]